MNIQQYLSTIGGILSIVGCIPYIKAILAGQTKPSKATWMIWATIDTIVLAGMYSKHALNGQIVGSIFGVWVIFFLAMIYGAPGWTRLDKFCLFGAAIGIASWGIFNSPVAGIVISLSVNVIGSIPTFTSAWRDPSKEDKLAWSIFWVACACTMSAIPKWTLEDVSQPISFFSVGTIMMYLLYIKPRFSLLG